MQFFPPYRPTLFFSSPPLYLIFSLALLLLQNYFQSIPTSIIFIHSFMFDSISFNVFICLFLAPSWGTAVNIASNNCVQFVYSISIICAPSLHRRLVYQIWGRGKNIIALQVDESVVICAKNWYIIYVICTSLALLENDIVYLFFSSY